MTASTSISGGLVSVEDGTKSAIEYQPPRKVRVELRFDVAEGQDATAILGGVASLAQAKVAELLGQTALSNVTTITSAATAPKTRKGGRADMIVDPPAEAGASTSAQPSQASANTSPASDEIPGLGGDTPVAEKPAADSLDDIMGLGATPEPVKEITDADLNAAVQKKNGELQSPPLIRDLIIKFQPDPSKPPLLANVAQAQRAQFLAELTTLAKAS